MNKEFFMEIDHNKIVRIGGKLKAGKWKDHFKKLDNMVNSHKAQ